MASQELWNVYAGIDFLTPGAEETLSIIEDAAPLDERSRVLDVAYGTGVGAMQLAERHGCGVLGVDTHTFAAAVAQRAAARGVADRVAFVIGDGGRLPVRSGTFDLAVCIGAPSIVGLEPCLAEMARALRSGGAIGVSDMVWARKPAPAEAIPDGYDIELLTLDEYADTVRRAGLDVRLARELPQSAWDAYYAPLRARIAELRAADPAAVPQPIEDELRIWDAGLGREYWRYAVFIARKA